MRVVLLLFSSLIEVAETKIIESKILLDLDGLSVCEVFIKFKSVLFPIYLYMVDSKQKQQQKLIYMYQIEYHQMSCNGGHF